MMQNEFKGDVSSYSLIIMKVGGPVMLLRKAFVSDNQSETI